MKTIKALLSIVSATTSIILSSTASADTHYVDISSTTPTAPYTNWVTAATNIQDAVDAALDGNTIFVTNGTYNENITVSKAITIQSINEPEVTIVDGQGQDRCFNLGSNACTISGFTITNGYSDSGAGIYCNDTTPFITNCIITGNYVNNGYLPGHVAIGGGCYRGTLSHCIIADNEADAYYGGSYGGGCYESTLSHCTLTGNNIWVFR